MLPRPASEVDASRSVRSAEGIEPHPSPARAEAASMPQLAPALRQGSVQVQVEARPEAAAAIDGETEYRAPQHGHLLLQLSGVGT